MRAGVHGTYFLSCCPTNGGAGRAAATFACNCQASSDGSAPPRHSVARSTNCTGMGLTAAASASAKNISPATVERHFQHFLRRSAAELKDAGCPRVLGIDEHFFLPPSWLRHYLL